MKEAIKQINRLKTKNIDMQYISDEAHWKETCQNIDALKIAEDIMKGILELSKIESKHL